MPDHRQPAPLLNALVVGAAQVAKMTCDAAEAYAQTLPPGPQRDQILQASSINQTFLALACRLIPHAKPKHLKEQARILEMMGHLKAQDEEARTING